MNKRIKELAEQFNLEIDPAHPDHNQKVLEKFAELIVRECVDKMEYEDSFYGQWMGRVIKEHFGVNE
jgi:hypothetical protein